MSSFYEVAVGMFGAALAVLALGTSLSIGSFKRQTCDEDAAPCKGKCIGTDGLDFWRRANLWTGVLALLFVVGLLLKTRYDYQLQNPSQTY